MSVFEHFGRWLRRRQGIERNPLYRIATDVLEGRITVEQAYAAAEQPSTVARLADGDLWEVLDEAGRAAVDHPEHALLLSRLVILAARQKGFDRVLMEANLRAADILAEYEGPSDEEERQREQELHLQEALRAARRIANAAGQRRALARLARLARMRGERDRARELLMRQLESGSENTDTLEDVETALMLGDLARQEGNLAAAREFYNRASRSARRVGHYAGMVDALLRQVTILRELGDLDATYALLQQAQEAAERMIDHRLQAEIAIQIGAILAEQRRLTQARTALLAALERARTAADLALESRSLIGLAQIERQAGKFRDAADHLHQLANLELRLGNHRAAIRALLDAAELALEGQQAQRALQFLQLAQQQCEAMEDTTLRQRLLGLSGLAHAALDHRGEALEYLSRAFRLAQQRGDVAEQARWLLGTGEVLLEFGELQDAITVAKHVATFVKATEDPRMEAQLAVLQGSIALARGLRREAEQYLLHACERAEQARDFLTHERALLLLAELQLQEADPHGAIGYLRQALDVATATGNDELRTRLHGRIARLYQSLHYFREAEEHYRAAATIAKEIESLPLQARALRGLAAVLDASGRVEEALATYRGALALFEQLGDRRATLALHYNAALLLLDQGNDGEARYHLRLAYELALALGDEELAASLRELLGPELRRSPAASEPADELLSESPLLPSRHEELPRDIP
ncbi:tetratricopeptide repeat protein [Thermomicrobium sp. CFH 73360]|uniref:tetratricopeptide repeat protein n=1 Tax=Thermomicrobium sp. CFH 73360 TaxID=2951987 RepID=UPI002076E09C|nr:tetratricopeptide repeat protein [Thermomicrobium sp. CFH 73360]MCM8746067.1 tetratricopeptide repeat protein [Thermomicrobium sp. CFH 73360]